MLEEDVFRHHAHQDRHYPVTSRNKSNSRLLRNLKWYGQIVGGPL